MLTQLRSCIQYFYAYTHTYVYSLGMYIYIYIRLSVCLPGWLAVCLSVCRLY